MRSGIWIYALVFAAGIAGGALGSGLVRAPAPADSGEASAAAGSGREQPPDIARQPPVVDPELASRLARLEERLSALEDYVGAPPPAGAETPGPAAVAPAVTPTPAERFQDDPRAALIDAGILPGRAEYLAGRYEALQYESLRQRYARRRGAQDAGPAVDPLQALRAEAEDDEFDRLLLALGQPNRVVVRDVLSTSAAERADIRAGDLIYAYGGERVFTLRDLRRGTFSSEAGATVAVELVRDGVPMTVYVPGGPIGVTVEARRDDPDRP